MKVSERVAAMEIEVKNLKDNNSKEHTEIKEMIKEFIESADKKYANKLVEKIVYALCGTVLLGFLGFILKMVFG